MRVLVCGPGDLQDQALVSASLDYWLQRLDLTAIIEDGQVSVDPAERNVSWEQRRKWGAAYLSKTWAETRRVKVIEDPQDAAEQKRLGAGARLAHLKRLIARHKPEYLIAFRGAEELAAEARRLGVRCIEVA